MEARLLISQLRSELRRTTLVVPASDDAKVSKARARSADAVLFDLEDGVAPSERMRARSRLADLPDGDGFCSVRVNAGLNELFDDIAAAVSSPACQEIVLPKVRSRIDVARAEAWMGFCESDGGRRRGSVGLGVQIEHVDALGNLTSIVKASSRLTSLVFGPLDFSASAGGVPLDGELARFARSQIAAVAAKAGVAAIDGPSFELDDMSAVAEQAGRAADLGFAGAWVVHPSQIEPVRNAFTPSAETAQRARDILAGMDAANTSHLGAARHDGEMIDEASAAWARAVLRRSAQ